jgi:hypothetical protein
VAAATSVRAAWPDKVAKCATPLVAATEVVPVNASAGFAPSTIVTFR